MPSSFLSSLTNLPSNVNFSFHHQGDSGGPLVKYEVVKKDGKLIKKAFLIGKAQAL